MDVRTLIDKAGGAVELAGLLGVARTTVLDWRRNQRIPGNRLAQISTTLGIPVEELLPIVQAPRVSGGA